MTATNRPTKKQLAAATGIVNAVLANHPELIKGRRPAILTDRRKLYQMYAHLEKVKEALFDDRARARKLKKYDEVQLLTEAIFHVSQSVAHLNMISRHRFHCSVSDLEVYK